MAARIFDKETLLDLSVNIIPLVIILFFIVTLPLFNVWGWEPMVSIVTIGLHVVPFVALAVLTYVAGKVIVSDERSAEVYHQGQANLEEATPRHADEDEH